MKTEYKVRSGWSWFFRIEGILWILATFYLLYIWLMNTDKTSLSVFLLFMFCGFVGMLSLYRGYSEQVILSVNGIQYRTFGYSVYTPWKNVKRAGTSRLGFYKFDGIFITYFSNDMDVWLPCIFEKEIFIPLGVFSKDWRESELGEHIKQYAPHLFSPVESQETI